MSGLRYKYAAVRIEDLLAREIETCLNDYSEEGYRVIAGAGDFLILEKLDGLNEAVIDEAVNTWVSPDPSAPKGH